MQHDLVVIGAGPGGYIAAIRAAQLGMNVACIEKEPALGGTCLRVGCIPSKALLESSERFEAARHDLKKHGVKVGGIELDLATMLKRKDTTVTAGTKGIEFLFKKNKVTRYQGHATITGANTVIVGEQALACKHIIIATGSVPSMLPGVEFDGDLIGDSTTALGYDKVPEHLVVIGGGVIGLELGSVWLRLGAKVTVLEYLPQILPGMDEELCAEALRLFKKQGFEFHLGAKVTGARVESGKCVVSAEGLDDINCDRVLLAVGRKPNTQGLGLENVGITPDKRGRIPVNSHWQTSVPNIYAIGDVIDGPMLAHKAEEEGTACAEYIATGHAHVNYDAIPGVVYTHPEIAGVGKTEQQLREAGVPYKAGKFPFMANGRARALGETAGFVKLLAHAETDRLLGAHIIGPRAGDLIAECAVAIEFAASAEDIARSSHAHPTLAECIKEAALAVHGRTLNG
ncbi:MAG: dihydrolipoyl dehydrogenase [Planctomycetes bacterium]|nr:dihydrolipoyl dehydrogenase [Planctomycetota bacterium]MCW8136219.1 dihydrolipoyl dehydrogenase [Planctomycetota bacterium]